MAKSLRPGERAPDFAADGSDGAKHTLDSFAGRPFVLYFYPADETPGCTTQACAFRDSWDEFKDLGVRVVGVSRDSVARHQAFVENRRLPFLLLADRGGAMHEAYGATMLGGLPRRVTYLIDKEGRVAESFDSHLRPGAHAPKMLAAARSLLD